MCSTHIFANQSNQQNYDVYKRRKIDMDKRYIIRFCSSEGKRWYEAHYSAGAKSNPMLFSIDDYRKFLQFTSLLDESGYKYIENQDEY